MNSLPPDPLTSVEGIVAGVLRTRNPEILEMIFATDEASFLEVAERAMLRCLGRLESGRDEYGALPELGLSKMLADMLWLAGFDAAAEAHTNGHVDVTIRHYEPGRFTYLGECKIYKGYTHHRDGCGQVLGYCTGRDRRAFCLDFFKVQGMYPKLAALQKRFDDQPDLGQQGKSRAHHFIKGAFLTTHRHLSSGADVELLHLGCNLHVAGAPPDAAGGTGRGR